MLSAVLVHVHVLDATGPLDPSRSTHPLVGTRVTWPESSAQGGGYCVGCRCTLYPRGYGSRVAWARVSASDADARCTHAGMARATRSDVVPTVGDRLVGARANDRARARPSSVERGRPQKAPDRASHRTRSHSRQHRARPSCCGPYPRGFGSCCYRASPPWSATALVGAPCVVPTGGRISFNPSLPAVGPRCRSFGERRVFECECESVLRERASVR